MLVFNQTQLYATGSPKYLKPVHFCKDNLQVNYWKTAHFFCGKSLNYVAIFCELPDYDSEYDRHSEVQSWTKYMAKSKKNNQAKLPKF